MKQWEDIVKERLEGYESTLPEGSYAQFQKLRAKGKQAPRKKVYSFVWAAVAAVAASLAAVLFLRQPAQPIEEGVQLVQQQPLQEQLPVTDSLTVEEPMVDACTSDGPGGNRQARQVCHQTCHRPTRAVGRIRGNCSGNADPGRR